MSHQVIITFDMDERNIQENAEKEAGRQIAKEIMDTVFKRNYGWHESKMKDIVIQVVSEMLGSNKDVIIQEAIKETVGKLCKTKAVKEKLAEALNEMEDE